jgi:hypothetical protein
MKKFLTILMCFQFVLMPVSFSYDEDIPLPDGVEEEVSQAQSSQNSMTGDEDGGYDFYFRQILVLSLSIIGSSVGTQCLGFWKTPSLDVFMAASALFILHEMTDGKTQAERRMTNFKDLEVNKENYKDKQLNDLNIALDQQENLKEYLINKKNWAIGLEVAFLAAMGVAIAEEIYSMTAAVTAGTAVCTAAYGACSAAAAALILPPAIVAAAATCAANEVACLASMNLGTAAVHTPFVVKPRETGTAACTPATVNSGACIAHLNGYLGLACAECEPILIKEQALLTNSIILGLTAVWSLGVAQSDGGLGWINTAGVAIFAVLGFILSFTEKAFLPLVSTLYNLPIPRSIAFGAESALIAVILGGLIHREAVVSENITKLDKVIKNFEETNTGASNGASTQSDSINLEKNKQGTLKSLAKIQTKESKTCMGADSSVSSKSCSNPRKFNKPKFEFGDIGSLTSASNLTVDAANSMAAGNSDAASLSMSQLASLAGRVRGTTNQLKKKLNDLRVSKGQKPIEFDGEVKKQIAQFEGVMNKAVASKGLPALGQSAAGLTPTTLEPPKQALAATPITVPTSGNLNNQPTMDFDMDEETPAEAAGAIAKTGQGIDQFDTNEADISKKSDVSIFVQLSNRYILNYNRIFQKASAQDKSEEKAPSNDKSATK